MNDKITMLTSELENKLDKIEWDIADIKYPFLELANIPMSKSGIESIQHSKDEVFNFECKITKKQYFEKRTFFNRISIEIAKILTQMSELLVWQSVFIGSEASSNEKLNDY